jgi:D-aminoacyl-tRNA deacylase
VQVVLQRVRRAAVRVDEEVVGAIGVGLVAEVGGGVLAISQFTLYGDTSKGRRPSFVGAAAPEQAKALYEAYCAAVPVPVQTGVFGAYMLIDLTADGPVTLRLEREGT